MSRSSDKGATEPLAALVAVFAVSTGLALYAGVLDGALVSATGDRNVAAPTADSVEQRLSTAGVVAPDRVADALAVIPTGYEGNVTVRAGQRWSVGPSPPVDTARARRTVSVRVAPATVRRGTLRVSVW
ncbi:hypothetical protein [Haloarcula sp. JP-L23]|uniref:DUF7285 family protein n=1 Tax=Haloarcula sp. JP-L23 TaxID=2716717 RepID=UPI00140EA91E|nr:hypothetical protein G9465_07685 [Haloarcula sp. JP-L23]